MRKMHPPCCTPAATAHLQIPVDDGGLALVQPGHSLAGVTEDLQDLALSEAGLQALVHQVHHLPPWQDTNTAGTVSPGLSKSQQGQ